MTYKEIAELIDSTGIKNSYRAFSEKEKEASESVSPPFIAFYYEGSTDFYADGENFQKIEILVIELYSREKDFENELKIEKALKAAGLTWEREEVYIDGEKLYEVTYTCNVIIKEE